tara:strand:- start:5855 stop:5992 length:138 start_codon:yes stop_codon:yes gene_type:complete
MRGEAVYNLLALLVTDCVRGIAKFGSDRNWLSFGSFFAHDIYPPS